MYCSHALRLLLPTVAAAVASCGVHVHSDTRQVNNGPRWHAVRTACAQLDAQACCPCLQTHPLNHSTSIDPASFDVVVVNTIVTAHWLRHQVEAWGLPFLRKTVW